MGFSLRDEDKSCVLCAKSTCITCNFESRGICTSCENGKYRDPESGQCIPCKDPNCVNCDIISGLCGKNNCKPGFFFDSLITTCAKCFTNIFCTSCNEDSRNVCTSCKIGTYRDPENQDKCIPCEDSNCEDCEFDSGICKPSSCKKGFTFDVSLQSCISCKINSCKTVEQIDFKDCTSCDNVRYVNPATKKCEICKDSNCAICGVDTGISSTCKNGFRLTQSKSCEKCSVLNCKNCDNSIEM